MSLALLLSATMLAAPQPVDDARRDLACSAATAWMAEVIPRFRGLKLIYSPDLQSLPERGRPLRWERPGGSARAPAPPQALLGALVRAGRTNAEPHCPTFAPQLSQLGVEFGPAALERAASAPRPPAGSEPFIGGVSMPVLSRDGREALLSSSGGQAIYQSASLIYMRRDAQGVWRTVATASLWYF